MHAIALAVFARMYDNQVVVGCVTILLLSFSAVNCQNGTECLYQYTSQPGQANCSPEAPLRLELRCQVTGNSNDNFTIQWHYSNSSALSSQSNISFVETVIDDSKAGIETQEEKLSGFTLVSILTLDYEMAAGYYWCTVNASHPTPNPSQVVNISTYPFTGETTKTNLTKCNPNIYLFETPMPPRCANDPVSVDIENVQLGSAEIFEMKGPVTTLDIKEPTTHGGEPTTHEGEPSPTTDSYKNEGSATIDKSFTDLDQSTTSPSNHFPMHFIWMIVGLAFALLTAIIIVMLIAIVYLNHKKNKIRVSSTSRSHIANTYFEKSNPDSLRRETLVLSMGATTGQQEIKDEAGYEIPTNVIHARNATFSGDHSPDSKTSSSKSALHTPPPEYEEVSTVKATKDSIRAVHRHQYEMVESSEQSEYSHLQHSHGGSRKFSTNSTGTAPSPSTSQNQGKISIMSSLSLSGHQPEPIFDSPEYMTIELDGSKLTKSWPETGEGVINTDTQYSHLNHEALTSMETTTREAESPDFDSEGYHQLPSVFIDSEEAKQQPDGEISPEQRQNSHTTNTHPPAHRHKSATLASEPYTPVESTNVMKRNAYSFTIVSTDEQYVSERGHVYHLLERSDEHHQNQSAPGSSEGSPKFRIQEDDRMKESSSIPPEQDSNKQKENEKSEEQSDSSSLQGTSMESSRKVIPPYSQVDKSKKKNRQPQLQLETQFNQETHHYHVLEQNSEDKIEKLCGEKGGPIYHTIDHEP